MRGQSQTFGVPNSVHWKYASLFGFSRITFYCLNDRSLGQFEVRFSRNFIRNWVTLRVRVCVCALSRDTRDALIEPRCVSQKIFQHSNETSSRRGIFLLARSLWRYRGEASRGAAATVIGTI